MQTFYFTLLSYTSILLENDKLVIYNYSIFCFRISFITKNKVTNAWENTTKTTIHCEHPQTWKLTYARTYYAKGTLCTCKTYDT